MIHRFSTIHIQQTNIRTKGFVESSQEQDLLMDET